MEDMDCEEVGVCYRGRVANGYATTEKEGGDVCWGTRCVGVCVTCKQLVLPLAVTRHAIDGRQHEEPEKCESAV